MQSLRYVFVRRLAVEHRLERLVLPCRVYVHPVVFLRAVGNGVILVSHALPVAPVAALEHVEVEPPAVVEPPGRGVAAAGVEGHQVVAVCRLYGGGQRVPHLRAYVALYVAAHYPHYVGLVLVARGQETAVGAGLAGVHQPGFHHAAPYTDHAHEDAAAGGLVHDIVEMVPVTVHPGRVGGLEVEAVGHRHLPVGVEGGDGVYHLHLHHIVAGGGQAVEIVSRLVAVEPLGQQPPRVGEPEEGAPVGVLEEAPVGRHRQAGHGRGFVAGRHGAQGGNEKDGDGM